MPHVTPCYGKQELYDSTDPEDHAEAAAGCRACPVIKWCGEEASKDEYVEGTRAGVLWVRDKSSSGGQRGKTVPDSIETTEFWATDTRWRGGVKTRYRNPPRITDALIADMLADRGLPANILEMRCPRQDLAAGRVAYVRELMCLFPASDIAAKLGVSERKLRRWAGPRKSKGD